MIHVSQKQKTELDACFWICETQAVPLHIITRRRLREFWRRHPAAEAPLRRWYALTVTANWDSFADLRRTFPNADAVGRIVVFNIGGNKFRVIAAVHFNRRKVFIRHVLTHAEYSRGDWKSDC